MSCRTASFFLLIPFIVFLLSPSFVDARREDPKKEYKRVQRELEKRQEALKKTIAREGSILKEMEALNRELGKLKREIKEIRYGIRKKDRQIREIKKEIKKISDTLGGQKRFLERQIQSMQKFGVKGVDALLTGKRDPRPDVLHLSFADQIRLLFSAEDIPDMVRRWRALEKIARYEYEVMRSYLDNIRALKEKEEELTGLLANLKAQKKKLYAKEGDLRDKKKQKIQLLASVRKERDLYKQMISELKESERRLRKMIEEEERQKAYIQKGFRKMKGRLPWPVNGVVVLPYGSYRDPKYKTPVFRNGIHIKTKENAKVRSVYSGKVVYADWFKGYGRVVIVNHGEGYHTVYANLSDIFLHKGDIIKKGQEIGRVGESGTINSPGLYFEVRYKGKPVNPIHWLKKRSSRKRR